MDSLETSSILPNLIGFICTYAGKLRELPIPPHPGMWRILFPALLGMDGGDCSSAETLERVLIADDFWGMIDDLLQTESLPANCWKLKSLAMKYYEPGMKFNIGLQCLVDTPWKSNQLDLLQLYVHEPANNNQDIFPFTVGTEGSLAAQGRVTM